MDTVSAKYKEYSEMRLLARTQRYWHEPFEIDRCQQMRCTLYHYSLF